MHVARVLIVAALVMTGCRSEPEPFTPLAEEEAFNAAASRAGGLRTVAFPDEDPGPPYYARVSTLLNQILHDGEYVAMPFYREPDCVPADFNLLEAFHFPGPAGPGSFGCNLLVEGRFLIEPGAPPGTFPLQVITSGAAEVWFVSYGDFQNAAADGDFTMAELLALSPMRGVARRFHEMLAPRLENHHVVITSDGELEDGRRFRFNVNHRHDRIQSIQIRIH
jgi:hypothetical protein